MKKIAVYGLGLTCLSAGVGYMRPELPGVMMSRAMQTKLSYTLIGPFYKWFYQITLEKHHHPTTMGELFRREIHREADQRQNVICSPCDGQLISHAIVVTPQQKMEVKGKPYSVELLFDQKFDQLKQNPANQLQRMSFYLSPKDYHHFHAPCDIKDVGFKELGGMGANRLSLSVHPRFTLPDPTIYIQNYRKVIKGKTKWGNIYIAFVGATLVNDIRVDLKKEYVKGS